MKPSSLTEWLPISLSSDWPSWRYTSVSGGNFPARVSRTCWNECIRSQVTWIAVTGSAIRQVHGAISRWTAHWSAEPAAKPRRVSRKVDILMVRARKCMAFTHRGWNTIGGRQGSYASVHTSWVPSEEWPERCALSALSAPTYRSRNSTKPGACPDWRRRWRQRYQPQLPTIPAYKCSNYSTRIFFSNFVAWVETNVYWPANESITHSSGNRCLPAADNIWPLNPIGLSLISLKREIALERGVNIFNSTGTIT